MSDIHPDDIQNLVEKRDYNFGPGRVKRVRTVVNLGATNTASTEITWFKKEAGEDQFSMTEKLKILSKREDQARVNIPDSAGSSLAAARNAAKQGEYMLDKSRGNYEATIGAVETLNDILVDWLGIEFQVATIDGDDAIRDGIRIAGTEPNPDDADEAAGSRLTISRSVRDLVATATNGEDTFPGVDFADYWSEEV